MLQRLKACLNKVANDYVVNVKRPKCILSDNGTQFSSKKWKDKLAELNIGVTFSLTNKTLIHNFFYKYLTIGGKNLSHKQM